MVARRHSDRSYNVDQVIVDLEQLIRLSLNRYPTPATNNQIQPSVANTPAFTLGSNAQNVLIPYLNSDQLDGFDGTAYLNTTPGYPTRNLVYAGATNVPIIAGIGYLNHTYYLLQFLDAFLTTIFAVDKDGSILISPNSPTTPIQLGANATGRLVTGLNADLLDGYHASTLPISLSVATGVLSISKGGTDATDATTAFNNLSPLNTLGSIITYSGTSAIQVSPADSYQLLKIDDMGNAVWGALQIDKSQAVDGNLPIGHGGTNGSTAITAFDNLSPLTSLGDLLVYTGSHNARLATGSINMVLTLTGSNGPVWNRASLTQSVTGILDIDKGGTNGSIARTAFNNLSPANISGDLIYFNGADNTRLPIGASGQFLGISTGNNLSYVSINRALTWSKTFENRPLVAAVTGGSYTLSAADETLVNNSDSPYNFTAGRNALDNQLSFISFQHHVPDELDVNKRVDAEIFFRVNSTSTGTIELQTHFRSNNTGERMSADGTVRDTTGTLNINGYAADSLAKIYLTGVFLANDLSNGEWFKGSVERDATSTSNDTAAITIVPIGIKFIGTRN